MHSKFDLVSKYLHPDFTALRKLGEVEMSMKVNQLVKMAFVKTEEANSKKDIAERQLRDLADSLSRIEDGRQAREMMIGELEAKAVKTKKDKCAIAAHKEYLKNNAKLADEIRAEAKKMQSDVAEMKALAKRYTDDFNAYIDEQMALFRSKGLGAERAYKDMMIPGGEFKKSDGEVIQLFKIVKRDVDLEPVETDENADGHALSVAAARSYSDKVGIVRDQNRGKYNDGHMLINGEAANIDRSEYADWVAM